MAAVEIQRDRLPFAYGAATAALAVTLLAVVSRLTAGPSGGTSPVVLAAMLGCGAVLVATYLRLDPGWVAWRRALAALTFTSIAYPGAWAVVALQPDSRLAGSLAAIGHVPQLVAFSVLPLLAVRYLGRGSTARRCRAGR